MKLSEFIKEKIVYFFILLVVIATIIIFLIPYSVEPIVIVYIILLPTISYIICYTFEYIKKKSYYDFLEKNLTQLEEKYLISEIEGDLAA